MAQQLDDWFIIFNYPDRLVLDYLQPVFEQQATGCMLEGRGDGRGGKGREEEEERE